MKKLMFACFAVSLAFTACKKSNDVVEPAHRNLITKITYDGAVPADRLMYTYTYDASNRMTTFARTSNPSNPSRNYTFTYNANGSLAEYFESIGNNKGKYTYNADGTVATQKEYSVSGAVETLYNTYTYTYAAGIVTENYVYSPTGNGFRQEYKYDVNGNNIEVKSYNTTPANPAGTFSGTATYGNYDAQNNPNSSYPPAFIFPGSAKNNYRSLSYNSGGTATYTYEYNADGYPTKRSAGSTDVSVYEYKRL